MVSVCPVDRSLSDSRTGMGGYDLFLPLMIVAASSYLTTIVFEPIVFTPCVWLKRENCWTHHVKIKAAITLMKGGNVVEKDFVVVHPEMDSWVNW